MIRKRVTFNERQYMDYYKLCVEPYLIRTFKDLRRLDLYTNFIDRWNNPNYQKAKYSKEYIYFFCEAVSSIEERVSCKLMITVIDGIMLDCPYLLMVNDIKFFSVAFALKIINYIYRYNHIKQDEAKRIFCDAYLNTFSAKDKLKIAFYDVYYFLFADFYD